MSILLRHRVVSRQAGAGPVFDPDAIAYIAALHNHVADIGAPYSLTDAQAQAIINQLFIDLKGTGSTTNNSNVYAQLYAMYPFVGAVADAHKYNAVNPVDSDAAFRMTWPNSATHSADGVAYNGSTQYGRPFITPSALTASFSWSVSWYETLEYTAVNGNLDELFGGTDGTNLINFFHRLESSGTVQFVRMQSGTEVSIVTNSLTKLGMKIGSRIANNNMYLYSDNSSSTNLVQNTGTTTVNRPTKEILHGAYNNNGSPITPFGHTPGRCAFSHFGEGLTAVNIEDLVFAVAKFQTSLGRNA